jgi:23S rRNA (uridine2552-2'-O)-methyltransferase
MRELQDHYFRLAKQEGYVARSAYKLIEIDERRTLLHAGDRVLDCGCAPGSWLQVASQRVGPRGVVVGIDLKPVRHRFDSLNVITIVGDITKTPAADLLVAAGEPRRPFDVILSDMAPDTSGDHHGDHHRSLRLCQSLLECCPELLRKGGHTAMKVFEGEAYRDFLSQVRERFESVKGFKPKASRSESREIYVIGQGYMGRSAPQPSADAAPSRRPPSGW